MPTHTTPEGRRPLVSRSSPLAQQLAFRLARSSITPNQISLASVVFAGLGAALLFYLPAEGWALGMAALCVQLRLACNLLDGMVAVEGGKATPTGALYNEFPDRVADSLLIVALGYAAGHSWLGWSGALLAALTAYIRATGASLGMGHDFSGPLAKPQRMAILTLACVAAAAELKLRGSTLSLGAGAAIIAVGSLATCALRTYRLSQKLKASA